MDGSWSCSDRSCPSTCSAWGDSHYSTFDGNMFDFHGSCDYVLAKGEGFQVNIQVRIEGDLVVYCKRDAF